MSASSQTTPDPIGARISLEMTRPDQAADVVRLLNAYGAGPDTSGRDSATWHGTGQELADSLRVAGWPIPDGQADAWTAEHSASGQKLHFEAPTLTRA